MTAAKVFMNGRSQAIRLPKQFRVRTREVFLKKTPEGFTVVERDYDSLVGVAGLRRGQPGSAIRKLRAFDHFTAIVGKGREDSGTQPLMESASMRIRG